MPRYPKAVWRPLPENKTEPLIKATQAILHSAVGPGSPFSYFERGTVVVESHFWVALDGTVEQFIDTARQADANYHANARAISIETADNGRPDEFPWTPQQQAAIVDLLLWAHREHGIPLVKTPAWDEPGIGYHTMWGAPGMWTPVAKTCPGRIRIDQFPGILSTAAQLAGRNEGQPSRGGDRPSVAPPFPLPAGWYFGPEEGPRESVSGYYSHAEDLKVWQRQMAKRGWRIKATGRYDAQTANVAVAFRAEKKIGPGGTVGARTWAAAWSEPVTR